jgi:hypothetical protein
MDFLTTSDIQTIIVPLVTTILAGLSIRMFFGAGRGSLMVSLSIAIGFVVSYWLVKGPIHWAIPTLDTLLPAVVIGGAVFGALMDELDFSKAFRTIIYLVVSLALVYFIGDLQNGNNYSGRILIRYGVVILACFWILSRMDDDRDEGLGAPLALMLASIGFAVVLTIYKSRYGLFASSLGAAALGFTLLNWPRVRFPIGASGIMAGALGLMTIMAIVGLESVSILAPPLGVCLLTFAVPIVTQRYFIVEPAFQPFIQILLSLPFIIGAGAMLFYRM